MALAAAAAAVATLTVIVSIGPSASIIFAQNMTSTGIVTDGGSDLTTDRMQTGIISSVGSESNDDKIN